MNFASKFSKMEVLSPNFVLLDENFRINKVFGQFSVSPKFREEIASPLPPATMPLVPVYCYQSINQCGIVKVA